VNARHPIVAGPRRRHGAREGSALLELAIILPFLTFLLLAVFDIGRAFAEQEAVTAAAREGARFYTHEPDVTAARAVVTADLNGIPAAPAQFNVDLVRMTVTVIVPYTHDLLFGLLERFGSNGTLSLSAAATMPLGVPPEPLTPYPTSTPAPTITPLPSLTPTSSPTRTPTPSNTPTVTATPACPSPTNGTACRITTGGQPYWAVLVTVINYQAGDIVTASLCTGSNPATCTAPTTLLCAGGSCGGNINQTAASFSHVRFTVTRPGSPCAPAVIQIPVFCPGGAGAEISSPTSTPTVAPAPRSAVLPARLPGSSPGAALILASARVPDPLATFSLDCVDGLPETGAASKLGRAGPCP
jgi:hypothetical protein